MKGLGNLLSELPDASAGEVFEALVEGGRRLLRVERIVSQGQGTPPGEWYDQDWHEWVAVLSGHAGLLMEGEDTPRVLGPGDHLIIPAHRRHRVAWTDPEAATVWLAVHYRA